MNERTCECGGVQVSLFYICFCASAKQCICLCRLYLHVLRSFSNELISLLLKIINIQKILTYFL